MSSLAISAITFGCVFGGALLGLALRTVLPEHHLSATNYWRSRPGTTYSALSSPGIDLRNGHRTSSLVDVRTNRRTGLGAVADCADSVAHYDLHQFRPLRARESHCRGQFFRLRAGGFQCDSPDSGDVLALPRPASHLQQPIARSRRATWPVICHSMLPRTASYVDRNCRRAEAGPAGSCMPYNMPV
jgi:hypothetical protein